MKTIKIIIITTVFVFVAFSFNMYGFYVLNQGCKVFPNQCPNANDGDYLSNQKINIGQLIIHAAGSFLQSTSDYQIVLKKIELTETGVIDSIGQAIKNMANANSLYFEIWNTSLSLEYDPLAIDKLSQFDYIGYQIENNLNPVIFQRVENFLRQGNVREIFQKVFDDSSKILKTLKEIQARLESGKKVDISDYWRLNQLYLDFALFGQYCSEVFVNL
jgi:hypothetical protein